MAALFITWSEAAKGGCREYAQLVSQLPALQKTWSTSQNGSLAYFLLAADSSSADHFGAFDTNRYGNYRRHLDALTDSGVARAFTLLLTSRAAGNILTQRLARESDLDVVVRLVDERGPWNHLLASTGFYFQRWFFFALFLAAAAIVLACTGRLLYTQGWRLNLVVGLYLTVLVYLVTMAAIPLQGYLTPAQCGFHLLFMLPGFIATYFVILGWTRTVGRLYPPTTMVALVSVHLAPCTVVLTLITTTLGVTLLAISYSASVRLWSVQRAGILTLQYAALPGFVLQLLSSAFLAVRTRCHVNRSPLTSSGLSALRRFTLLVGLLTLGWLLVALALLLTLTGRVVERPSLYLGRIVLHQLGALVLSTIVLIDLSMHRYRDAPTIVTATATSTVTNASVIDVPLNAELSTARSGGPLSFTEKPTKSKLTMAISSSSFFHFTSSSPMVADRPTAQFLKRTVGSRSGHQRLTSMQEFSPVMSAPSFNTAPGGSSHRNDSHSPLASTPELRFQDDAYFTTSP
ncbi:hypothetical protein IWQ60_003216 [Tieghemiomyces parasiticus]|uniref:Uncharacterized protein n=1 Tax=Tieghemiomyces parasiticus TaxID=78921 RepID=A0A9W8AHT6_9FUNG|nr:hypothetical protein IWQ60_003216 [Tieghemiomyces parasiticus]